MGCNSSRQAEETPVSSVVVKMTDTRRPSASAQLAQSLGNWPEYIVTTSIHGSERMGDRNLDNTAINHPSAHDGTTESRAHDPENSVANPEDEYETNHNTNSVVTSPAHPPTSPPDVKCSYCCETIDRKKGKVLRPCKSCSMPICNSCIRKLFVDAYKNEANMPPRCCVPIPVTYARLVLSAEEVTLFKEKYEEWSTPNRVYCPIPTCSAFIPYRLFPTSAVKDRIPAQKGANLNQTVPTGLQTPPPTPPLSAPEVAPSIPCPKCAVLICCSCKQLAHPGTPCSETPDIDPEIADLLQRWGIKRCPKCRAAVRRMYGCSHIQCRCGAQWCWWCTGPIRVCRARPCPAEQEAAAFEEEINAAADERYEREMEGNSDADTESETSVVLEQGAPAPEPLINLDAGWHWEDAREDFGSEPSIDDLDPFNCNHMWDSVEEGEIDEEIDYECGRCWRKLVPYPSGHMYLGIRELLETGSFTGYEALQKPQMATSDSFINLCRRCGIILCGNCRELDSHQHGQ